MGVHINDLMYDFEKKARTGIFEKINLKGSNADFSAPLFLCMGSPNIETNIDSVEVEVDLFENAIYRLVKDIYCKCEYREWNEIHVIFDMPPSYERHAEQILKHLLLDTKSRLYMDDKARDEKDSFEHYAVNLYMISSVSMAHVELNKHYIENFFRNSVGYSNALAEFINAPEKPRFYLRFIGNDVTGIIEDPQLKPTIEERINNSIMQSVQPILKYKDGNEQEIIPKFSILSHMKFSSQLAHFTETKEEKTTAIENSAKEFFDSLFWNTANEG